MIRKKIQQIKLINLLLNMFNIFGGIVEEQYMLNRTEPNQELDCSARQQLDALLCLEKFKKIWSWRSKNNLNFRTFTKKERTFDKMNKLINYKTCKKFKSTMCLCSDIVSKVNIFSWKIYYEFLVFHFVCFEKPK